MLKKLGLNREQIKYLTLVISYASSLESQGSMPRYGWEIEDRIIMPSEVYTANVTKELLKSAIESLNNVIGFFNEFKGLPEDLSEVVEQLKKVVEDASGKIE